nr:cell division protein ZapA [Lysobacter penaei]
MLDREYTVGCEPEEQDSLLEAARLLDGKMREVRGGNRMAALDRVAVLAALNLAHELQQLKQEEGQRHAALARTLGDLHRKLDGLLDTP